MRLLTFNHVIARARIDSFHPLVETNCFSFTACTQLSVCKSMAPRLWLLAGCLAAVVLCGSPLAQAKVFVTVAAHSEACFDEYVEEGTSGLRGFFEVVRGGQLDIDVSVSKEDALVQTYEYAQQGDLDIPKGPGKYRVCFSNKMSSVTEKHVGFALHGSSGELVTDEDVAKKQHIRPIETTVQNLADKVQRLQEVEKYLHERLKRHMQTAESTASRVLITTGVEALVLLLVNAAQIWYLRRYFEKRRTL